MTEYKYKAYFTLVHPVNDFKAAYEYLTKDDMTKYLLNDSRGCSKVKSVRWELEDEDSGYVEVKTSEALTAEERENISSWISGQCSDGLGEGFEQQNFAWYSYDDDDEDGCGEGAMASFDWETNNYALELVIEYYHIYNVRINNGEKIRRNTCTSDSVQSIIDKRLPEFIADSYCISRGNFDDEECKEERWSDVGDHIVELKSSTDFERPDYGGSIWITIKDSTKGEVHHFAAY